MLHSGRPIPFRKIHLPFAAVHQVVTGCTNRSYHTPKKDCNCSFVYLTTLAFVLHVADQLWFMTCIREEEEECTFLLYLELTHFVLMIFYYTLCPEKKDQQYFGHNFDKFRQIFRVFLG